MPSNLEKLSEGLSNVDKLESFSKTLERGDRVRVEEGGATGVIFRVHRDSLGVLDDLYAVVMDDGSDNRRYSEWELKRIGKSDFTPKYSIGQDVTFENTGGITRGTIISWIMQDGERYYKIRNAMSGVIDNLVHEESIMG